jgi:hypothetical protein
METSTTCGDPGGQNSVYADWYPRVVAAAHRLVARRQLGWVAKSSDFLLLLRNGCHAAEAALGAIRRETPAAWRELAPRGRVNVAVRTAARAMAAHLQAREPTA